ncbi:MAG: NAD+ synthase [Candidatus Thioglobus sp.]|nr:MAG: NAD+ synthase [Candidatus Thioglobus sp.]
MIKIALAQLNFLVGDIEGNCQKMLHILQQVKHAAAVDCVVFSELAIIGYPPEDLLFRPSISRRITVAMDKIQAASKGLTVVVGAPSYQDGKIYNAACVMQDQVLIAQYHKNILPNYNVFDEKRYFHAGTKPCVFTLKGCCIGLSVCEDIWNPQPIAAAKQAGAQLIININASPYHIDKDHERVSTVAQRVAENQLAILYLNQVGGQDELVFDGSSFAMDKNKQIVARAKSCQEDVMTVDFDHERNNLRSAKSDLSTTTPLQLNYNVLQLALADYVNKNGFQGGLVGLSGGIDSALVLALAVDALGAERVHAVMMPSRYTSEMSLEDARQLASNVGVEYSVIEIEPLMQSFDHTLDSLFAGQQKDSTEENIQARIRGVLLMALSNKFGHMVISTGNKSEMAVGYSTLYGDMAGGFAPLKDVPKMLVYQLANYRNTLAPVIPQRIIDRPPSAELAPDQLDQDSLPPYDQLDEILAMFIEQEASREEIMAQGFAEETVSRVINMVFRNEYKRRQAPPGVKITKRAFGKDRRYPITSGALKYLNEG